MKDKRTVTLARLRTICEKSETLRGHWNAVLCYATAYWHALAMPIVDMADIDQVRASTTACIHSTKGEFETRCRILFTEMSKENISHPEAINIYALIALYNKDKLPAAETA